MSNCIVVKPGFDYDLLLTGLTGDLDLSAYLQGEGWNPEDNINVKLTLSTGSLDTLILNLPEGCRLEVNNQITITLVTVEMYCVFTNFGTVIIEYTVPFVLINRSTGEVTCQQQPA